MWMQAAAVAAIVVPLGLDLYMPAPEHNIATAEKITLGRRLFSDRRLSRDRSRSCASCHRPDRAFSDGRPIAIGVFGRRGTRNAPALVNRGYGRLFFWDGRTTTLEEQVLRPISDPNEMDLPVEEAARRVGLTSDEISHALASYVRSILSGNSDFDRFVGGQRDALSAEEQRGLQVFRGKGNCTACHVGPNFTDERVHNTGVAFAAADAAPKDRGRAIVTGVEADLGAFKTPTLREIARTAPYMHDGSLASLEAVVDFYDRGGNPNPHLDDEIRPARFAPAEKRALVAFLKTLSGELQEGGR
jgi:cytochrome c peroxidase